MSQSITSRRNFIKSSAAVAAGLSIGNITLASNKQAGVTTAAAAVPEPGTLTLLY